MAVAVDNVGGMTASAPVPFTVSATLTTRVLQRGLSGYAGVSDTYLDRYLPTTVRGALDALLVDPFNYNSLLRFAIYQSDGGPVPNGAVIQSATLALYKGNYDDTLRLNALLKPWVEGGRRGRPVRRACRGPQSVPPVPAPTTARPPTPSSPPTLTPAGSPST